LVSFDLGPPLQHIGAAANEMLTFIALLFLGYIYAWRKGALEWV
jgi:NADH:ubiquinone oxidoreductase subunit 3 (subunit A)